MHSQTAELMHALNLLRASTTRALDSIAFVEEYQRHSGCIVTPQDIAANNGHDPEAVRQHMIEQHRANAYVALNDIITLAERIKKIVAPPKDETAGGRLNGLRLAE